VREHDARHFGQVEFTSCRVWRAGAAGWPVAPGPARASPAGRAWPRGSTVPASRPACHSVCLGIASARCAGSRLGSSREGWLAARFSRAWEPPRRARGEKQACTPTWCAWPSWRVATSVPFSSGMSQVGLRHGVPADTLTAPQFCPPRGTRGNHARRDNVARSGGPKPRAFEAQSRGHERCRPRPPRRAPRGCTGPPCWAGARSCASCATRW
jgi:hypothetical protein